MQYERIFKEFLEIYLPKKLDVSTGTIVYSDGRQSKQLDIIISDRAKAPILYEEAGIRTMPIECVYSVIEVKSKLDIKVTEKCLANMKSVRQLKKKAYYEKKDVIGLHITCMDRSMIYPLSPILFSPSIQSTLLL